MTSFEGPVDFANKEALTITCELDYEVMFAYLTAAVPYKVMTNHETVEDAVKFYDRHFEQRPHIWIPGRNRFEKNLSIEKTLFQQSNFSQGIMSIF